MIVTESNDSQHVNKQLKVFLCNQFVNCGAKLGGICFAEK
jgi:hypothetical protein